MSKSSWHCFWMIATVEAVVLSVLSVLAVFGGQQKVAGDLASGNLGVAGVIFDRLASDAASLAALFFAGVALLCGTAWVACSMAFRERQQEYKQAREAFSRDLNPSGRKTLDVSLRG